MLGSFTPVKFSLFLFSFSTFWLNQPISLFANDVCAKFRIKKRKKKREKKRMTTLYSLWDAVKLTDFTGRCGQVGVTTAGVVTNGKISFYVL